MPRESRRERKERERRSVNPGQHIVLHTRTSVQRVQPHIDPIRELLGEPAPGQSALDKMLAQDMRMFGRAAVLVDGDSIEHVAPDRIRHL